jgi:hypothetical protein
MFSSELPALATIATTRVRTGINQCQIHRGGVAAGDCGMVCLQILDDFLNSSLLYNFVVTWFILKSDLGHVTQDKWRFYDMLTSLVDKAIEGMIQR